MANLDENFVVKTGLTVGSTTITAATGDIAITSGNVTIGSTVIDAATGNITVGPTTINGTTGAIYTTANVVTTSNFIVGSTVLSPTGQVSTTNIVATGGTINNTVIGGSTAAAAHFTTLSTTGNLTVSSDILPSSNSVINIGSATNRFATIYVNEARLSTNTLYLGDTAILGTSANTVNIHADPGQAISMQTSGAAGVMTLVSNAQISVQSTGNNADVILQSNGTGSKTRLLSSTEIDLNAPLMVFTGNVQTTGNEIVNGTLTVNGNVVITGTQATVDAGQLTVKDDVVIINSSETGVGITSGFAGIQFARGQVSSYRLGFQESDDTLQFGAIGNTYAVPLKDGTGGKITGNLQGNADTATTAGTVTTAAQPTITSVGTLTSLGVTGNVTANTFFGSGAGLTSVPNGAFVNSSLTIGTTAIALGASSTTLAGLTNVTSTTFTGNVTGSAATVTAAAQPAITSVGTLSGLSVTATITGNISGSAATVTAAAQPAITSVGTLSSLAVTANVVAAGFSGTHYGSGAGLTSVPNGALTNSSVTVGSTAIALGGTSTTLAGLTGVTSTTFTGNVVGTNLTGTLQTAAQPNVTSVGTLASLATTGDAVIGGNLTVNGTTTTVNSTTVSTADLNITLASGAGTAAAANGAGLTVAGANATLLYGNANDNFTFNKRLDATSFYGSGAGLSATSVPNSALQNSGALTVTAGTGLSGGGSVALGSTTTLSLPNVDVPMASKFAKITTDAQGRVSGNVAVAQADITGLLGASSITNTMLANSSLTIGSTSVTLGGTVATFSGVTLSSPTFTSPVLGTPTSGNLSSCTFPTLNQNTSGTATYATNVAGGTANQIPYQTGAGATSFYTAANYGVQTYTATGVPASVAGAAGVLQGSASAIPAFTTTPTLTGTNFTGIPNGGLTNSAVTVTAGTGMSGGGAVSLGGTVTLTNAGVTQISGTANQITASVATGAVTLSLPTNLTGVTINSTTIPSSSTIVTTAAGTATLATSLTGGGAGTVPYQSAAGTTAMATAGSTSTVLIGGAAPSFTNTPTLTGTNFTSIPNAAIIGLTNSATTTAATANVASQIVLRDAGGGFSAGIMTATATIARYADLAECYTADAEYGPATVVEFGGDAEVTLCLTDGSTKIAGVVSTNPAYLMNSELAGTKAAVALQGRVPCNVTGKIAKGDMLVAAGNGKARAEANPKLGQVIGKALGSNESGDSVIEVVVGRM